MARPAFPANLREFQRQFATEEACQQYLAASRWPEGFRCPRCGHRRAYPMLTHHRWRCVDCRYQVSLTAGTVLHNTKLPLTVWFWATYLLTTDTRGISALLLQRQLGLRRYETAWMLLHKLRRAMVNLARAPLHGELKRFSNRPCTTWGGRGTFAHTDAGGPMRAYSMDLRERALLDSDAGMKAADVAGEVPRERVVGAATETAAARNGRGGASRPATWTARHA